MHLEKHRTYAPTFPVQLKGISKCRKRPFYYDVFFGNKKVITTQLATFEDKLPVLSRFMAVKTTSASSRLEKICFEFPAFFLPDQH